MSEEGLVGVAAVGPLVDWLGGSAPGLTALICNDPLPLLSNRVDQI
jgi:hypothetical protein